MSLLVFFLVLSLSSRVSFSQNDEATLLRIKEQLGNPIELKSWVSGSDYCMFWAGIRCTSTCRVRSLFLGHLFDVNTTFPPSIVDLSELEDLMLFLIPGLYGTIPYCLSNLSHLKNLEIADTSLSGPIPSFLSRTNLSQLIIQRNKFSGPIPKSLSKLKYLNWLDLSSSHLTGTIPPRLVHGSPSQPSVLALGYNDLTGELPDYYRNSYFTSISLKHNRLSGDPSFLFGNQKEVHLVELSYNEFEFDLSNIEVSDKLDILDLSHNRITGSVPKSIEGVRWIDLSYNQLCGPIPWGTYSSEHSAQRYENNTCLCGEPRLQSCS